MTLFALRPGTNTASFHEIAGIVGNYHQFSYSRPKIHVEPCRRRLFLPAGSSSGGEASGILDAARLIEIQMSISRTYEHILPNGNGERGGPAEERSVVNAECFSCPSRCRKRSPDRAHVCSRILSGGRGSQAPRLYLRLVHRCCFIAMLDGQICLGSGADLLLSRPRRPPRLALTCPRRTYNTTKGYKNISTRRRSGDKCSLCINRGRLK